MGSGKCQAGKAQRRVLRVFPLREETPCGVTTNTAGPCETKPIPAGGHRWARTGKVAQAAATGSKRAKQSQFPHGQQWARVGKVPVPPVEPIVRNKANSPTIALWERSCATSAAHGDSAKQSQFPPAVRNGRGQARSPRPLPLGQSVRNKANFRTDSNGPGSARHQCRR